MRFKGIERIFLFWKINNLPLIINIKSIIEQDLVINILARSSVINILLL